MKSLIIALSFFIISLSAEYLEVPRYYQIQNKDGYYMTVGGGTQRDVKILTEDLLDQTNPRQRFYVRFSRDRFEISPESQNSFRSLVLGLDRGILTQQIRRGASLRNQRFHIRDITVKGTNETSTPTVWAIQHDLTGNCLYSEGKSGQIASTICDASSETQQWTFNAAAYIVQTRN